MDDFGFGDDFGLSLEKAIQEDKIMAEFGGFNDEDWVHHEDSRGTVTPASAGAMAAAAAAMAAATSKSSLPSIHEDGAAAATPARPAADRDVAHISDHRSGWMKRQAATGFMTISKKWKENWFSLKDGILTFSESVTTPPLGKIDLRSLQGLEYSETDTQSCKFGLTAGSKKYTFWTRTPQDCQLWVKTIQKASNTSTAGFGSAVNTTMLF